MSARTFLIVAAWAPFAAMVLFVLALLTPAAIRSWRYRHEKPEPITHTPRGHRLEPIPDGGLSLLELTVPPLPEGVEAFPIGGRARAVFTRASGVEPVEALIFAELEAEWPEWLASRERALLTPTQEFRTLMVRSYSLAELLELEDIGALMEPCSHCAAGDHRPASSALSRRGCPGCACPCSLEAVSHG